MCNIPFIKFSNDDCSIQFLTVDTTLHDKKIKNKYDEAY